MLILILYLFITMKYLIYDIYQLSSISCFSRLKEAISSCLCMSNSARIALVSGSLMESDRLTAP